MIVFGHCDVICCTYRSTTKILECESCHSITALRNLHCSDDTHAKTPLRFSLITSKKKNHCDLIWSITKRNTVALISTFQTSLGESQRLFLHRTGQWFEATFSQTLPEQHYLKAISSEPINANLQIHQTEAKYPTNTQCKECDSHIFNWVLGCNSAVIYFTSNWDYLTMFLQFRNKLVKYLLLHSVLYQQHKREN